MNRPLSICPSRVRGAVLFVALVFLILVTLLALTATSTSILQEKMTGGMRNRQLGLMGAESATRGGEAYFTTANFSGSNPLPACGEDASGNCAYRPDLGKLREEVQQFRTASGWVDPATVSGRVPYVHGAELASLSGDAETARLHEEPVVIVEDLGANVAPKNFKQTGIIDPESQNAAWLYRITARSQGGSGAVIRVVESIYSPSLNLGNAGANTAAPPSP